MMTPSKGSAKASTAGAGAAGVEEKEKEAGGDGAAKAGVEGEVSETSKAAESGKEKIDGVKLGKNERIVRERELAEAIKLRDEEQERLEQDEER